jgi:hypothetical protein
MCKAILIKPHHLIDVLTALGGGQARFEPHPSGHAVHTLAERLVRDRDALLEMELGADDICRPWVHNVDGACDDAIDTSFRPEAPSSKREYNLLIDGRWCRKLGLAQGDRLTASEFCRRLEPLLDEISEVYREIPKERTEQRAADLGAGIGWFLAEANDEEVSSARAGKRTAKRSTRHTPL